METSENLTFFLTYRLARLHQILTAQGMRVLRKHCDLSINQWRVLSCVIAAKGATSKDVVQISRLDPAIVSRMLQTLEREGLVITQRPAHDRRTLAIEVTPEGHTLHDRVMPKMRERQKKLMNVLDERERTLLFEAFSKLEAEAEHSVS